MLEPFSHAGVAPVRRPRCSRPATRLQRLASYAIKRPADVKFRPSAPEHAAVEASDTSQSSPATCGRGVSGLLVANMWRNLCRNQRSQYGPSLAAMDIIQNYLPRLVALPQAKSILRETMNETKRWQIVAQLQGLTSNSGLSSTNRETLASLGELVSNRSPQ